MSEGKDIKNLSGQAKSKFAQKEEEILAFWQEKNIFKKTLEKDSPKGEFVFYEGPPTANGMPGIHHFEARAFKDAVPRYKTMQGFHVRRKAGWDTHGLPVELAMEKELKLTSKKDIEKYGVAEFNKKCKESVFRHIDEWSRFTDRMGYWVDKENAYFTFDNSYIESVWNVIKKTDEQNLLYKDYKVVPWCPRCGTGLSSHELAQGYKDVKDLSVYVKFLLQTPNSKLKTFLLAWTTTPWTLPGNVALAINEKIIYSKVQNLKIKTQNDNSKSENEIIILAKERINDVLKDYDYDVVEEIKGKDLVGLEYEPLYPFLKDNLSESEKDLPAMPAHAGQAGKLEKAFKVYAGDFVTTEDGTGIVHIAPMYGQDDFALGNKENLPKYHLVKEDGTFKEESGFLAGKFVKAEETAVDIIKDLAHRGLLFKKEKHEHSYPHCWRCHTPLIYFARDSWYIKMSSLREKLISENEKINWEPEYIKEGRFGEWLKDVKDWAISRERYWGTPLPVWISEEGKEKVVVDSVETLKKHTKKSGNKYFLMRHGEAEQNILGILSSEEEKAYHLTQKGREEVKETAKKLKKEKIDIIIHSPLVRIKETVEELVKILGEVETQEDQRLTEEKYCELSGMKCEDFTKHFPTFEFRLDTKVAGCETLREVKRRIGEFIYETEKKYEGKNILIVTHDGPAKLFFALTQCPDDKKLNELYMPGKEKIPLGSFLEFDFTPLPHDEDFVLDLHKPYIDEVELISESGRKLVRAKEVMDVWLDSGAMPFAQDHYPFENKDFIDSKKGYPADFISEAIDQTRGWFYTLHAVGALLGKGRAYKNVICLGHLNDKDGKKMSKSIGNVIDPNVMIEKYGADAIRLWMYSVNQPGEPKNFDEKTVDEIVKKNFNLLSNVLSFYELYRDRKLEVSSLEFEDLNSENVLDKWILARFSGLATLCTENMEAYKMLEPVRAIRGFIEDLSTWYLRRSRDRFRDGDEEAKKTLYFILKNIAKILAPFAPFYAESLYLTLRNENDLESVHLEKWPEKELGIRNYELGIIENMQKVREISSLGLKLRSDANINVRQPLASLRVSNHNFQFSKNTELLELIKDEVNVKEIIFVDKEEDVGLYIGMTAELQEEGIVREIIRAIQDMRKKKGLSPKDKVSLKIELNALSRNLFESEKVISEIKKSVLAQDIDIVLEAEGDEIILGDIYLKVEIQKI